MEKFMLGVSVNEALAQSQERLSEYTKNILEESDSFHAVENIKLREVMICQVCKEDHKTLVNKEWCDRSLLEIENDYLKAENARLREALGYYADDESGTDNCEVARRALKGGE
jgi:hypothetical protein